MVHFNNLFYSLDIVVSFSQTMYNVVENNGSVQPVLIFSNPSSFDITVQVVTNDISAVGVNTTNCSTISGDNDYTMGLYNVTFPANVTTRTFDIPICDDMVLEDYESFSISIVSNSLPDNVTIGSFGQATIMIIEDDSKCLKHL